MAACPQCGSEVQEGWRFCTRCGYTIPGALAASGPAPAAPPSMALPPPPPGFVFGPQRTQVERTKTGVLLLLVGAVLGWIPYISLVGGLLTLIGAVLVILGRKAFGPKHARNVVYAIVLFLVGLLVILVLAVLLAVSLVSGFLGGAPDRTAVESAMTAYLYGATGVAIASGLSSVLFTYALQKTQGRILLWAGYASHAVLEVAIVLIVAPAMGGAFADAFAGGAYNPAPIDALLARADLYGLAAVIPSMFYAAANYLAWSRIEKGELPEPPPSAPPPVHPA